MKAGVHLANDGNVTDRHLELIRDLPLVKALVRLDNMGEWDEVDWGRLAANLRADCEVVLRLYFPGFLPRQDFVGRTAARLPGVIETLAPRKCWVEIHNEPNHCTGQEGWGPTAKQAEEFGSWYAYVLRRLRSHGFGNLGFPGLALGEGNHKERTWARQLQGAIKASDWLGVHCYWQTEEQLNDISLGQNWLWYRHRFPMPIIVTEVANSGCDGSMGAPPPDVQARQYRDWCRAADEEIQGAAFFILGGRGWDGFQVSEQAVQAVGG